MYTLGLYYMSYLFMVSVSDIPEVFPCLSQNTIILLIIENSILKKQPILFMEQAFLLGEIFLKIYNPKDYSFRTSAKKYHLTELQDSQNRALN